MLDYRLLYQFSKVDNAEKVASISEKGRLRPFETGNHLQKFTLLCVRVKTSFVACSCAQDQFCAHLGSPNSCLAIHFVHNARISGFMNLFPSRGDQARLVRGFGQFDEKRLSKQFESSWGASSNPLRLRVKRHFLVNGCRGESFRLLVKIICKPRKERAQTIDL